MEFMGACCAFPVLLVLFIVWTSAAKNGRITKKHYWLGLGVASAFMILALSAEIRYVVFVEGLIGASWDGDTQRVQWLLEHGANPNLPDDNEGCHSKER